MFTHDFYAFYLNQTKKSVTEVKDICHHVCLMLLKNPRIYSAQIWFVVVGLEELCIGNGKC